MERFFEAFTETITRVFLPILRPVFDPINSFLAIFPEPVWRASAVGLFVLAMIGVFLLKKEYVNLDAPSDAWYYDLRIWTIVSMLPHVFVYLYF